MGRHYCVAVLFLVCALHLVDNYPVIQNFERRAENGDTELHTRTARHVRGWHKGPKRGKWRHYNAINDNKATADHSDRDENGKETGVSFDERPDNFDIWGGNTPNGHHDWSNNEGDRHHLDHGPGRRRGKGQRKGKRKNRWNANHRSYDKYWEKPDDIRDVSDKDKHGTNWWTDFWGNDENKQDRSESDQKDLGHWGHGDKESHKPHHRDKDENNWWNELWGCDKKGSGKHGEKWNWWDDLWRKDEDDDSWWDNLWGKADEESDTDWWSDLWGNDKEDNDWSGNDDDSFSWWDDLWGNGESESDESDEDDDDWWNNLWDNDDKHHNSWITDEWFNDSRDHDNKDSAENHDDDWLDDLLNSDVKDKKEIDDNGHDWWSDWWRPDVEDSQSDEQDYWSIGDGEDTNLVDDLSGNGKIETDWWNDFWGDLFRLNGDTDELIDDHLNNHEKGQDSLNGLWDVLGGLLSELVNAFCGKFSVETGMNTQSHDVDGNLNGSPLVKPNSDINGNANNPENTDDTVDEESNETNEIQYVEEQDTPSETQTDDYSDESHYDSTTVDEDSGEPNDTHDVEDEDKESEIQTDDNSDETQDDETTDSSKYETDHTEDEESVEGTDMDSADEYTHGNTGYGEPAGVNPIDTADKDFMDDKDDGGSVSGHTVLSQGGSASSGGNSYPVESNPVGGNYETKPNHFRF